MVRKTFGIYSNPLEHCNLFIETGSDYIACWCKDSATNVVKAFELFSFTQNSADDFAALFKEVQLHSRLLTTSFENVYCIWGNEKCVCVPAEYYNDETAASYMELMFGESCPSALLNNTAMDCVTVFELPQSALDAYSKAYTVKASVHKYYQLIKGQQSDNGGNKMHVLFYHSHCIISAYKQGVLQLIQTYPYKVSEDVLYVLLNIAKAYQMPVSETPIYAGGLIDTSSPLYKTLHVYLNGFCFEPVDAALFTAEGFQDHPLHYFAPFCQYDV